MDSLGKVDFEKLFYIYYKPLCRFCIRFVRDHDTAEEIVQEQFIHLWNKRKEISAIESVEAYLRRCIRNRALDYLKSAYFKIEKTDVSSNINLYEVELPDVILEVEELQQIINEGLKKMPERCYNVFALKRFDNCSNKEIARRLNISIKSVENYTTLAMNYLRSFIKDNYPLFSLCFFLFL